MKKNSYTSSLFFFLFILTFSPVYAQITLSGQFTWVDPGDSYSYSVGGAPGCPNNYQTSTTDGTNTANGTGNGSGTGPFTYKWDNKAGGDFKMNAINGHPDCSSIAPKIINNISHIYLAQPGGISVPGGTTLNCGTSPVMLTVSAPTTSPSFNVTNTSQSVQLIYTWNIPNWGINNVQTSTNQLSVTPNINGNATVTVSVKRNDAKVSTSTSITIIRPLPTFSSVSLTSFMVCNSSTTQSVSATGTNADKFVWTPSSNIRINGNSGPQTVAGAVNIGATGDGTFTVQAYSSACNAYSSSSPAYSVSYGTIPTITYPINTLVDATTGMWQLSYANAGSTSATYTLTSGSATLQPFQKDCYATTLTGAVIAVVGSNACGSSTPYYYSLPAVSSEMMAVYPNPATDQIAVQFESTSNPDVLPESMSLVSETSSEEVKSVNVQKVYKNKAFHDKDKIILNVKELPRGVYYLNSIPTNKSKQKPYRIRIVLE